MHVTNQKKTYYHIQQIPNLFHFIKKQSSKYLLNIQHINNQLEARLNKKKTIFLYIIQNKNLKIL
jgi:hypothetical protein